MKQTDHIQDHREYAQSEQLPLRSALQPSKDCAEEKDSSQKVVTFIDFSLQIMLTCL